MRTRKRHSLWLPWPAAYGGRGASVIEQVILTEEMARAGAPHLPGVLGLVETSGGVYGIPQDFGPGVMYYRKDVFDEAGVEVPTTWAEFAAAAEAIHAKNPEHFITFTDPGLVDAAYMGLWQLGAAPWSVEGGTNVNLDLKSDKAKQWADYWTDLNNRGLTIEGTMGAIIPAYIISGHGARGFLALWAGRGVG